MSVEALNAQMLVVWQRIERLEQEVAELKRQLARRGGDQRDDDRRDFHQSRP